MSNEENPDRRHGQPDPYGGWQPTPQSGEYDAEATAFVHLDPEDLANLGNDPLAAPGQGYVPPMILPLTPAAGLDPAATGSWVVQTQSQQERAARAETAPDAVHWPDPNQQEPYGQQYPQTYPSTSQYEQTSSTTAQWNFTETVPAAGPDDPAHPHPHAPGHVPAAPSASASAEPVGHTGRWTIPVANGDLPDESGEFAASSLASQWYAETPPATLPGGAPAPWATQEQALPEAPAPEAPAPEAPAPEASAPEPSPEPQLPPLPEPAAGPEPSSEAPSGGLSGVPDEPDAPEEAPGEEASAETPFAPEPSEDVQDAPGTPAAPEEGLLETATAGDAPEVPEAPDDAPAHATPAGPDPAPVGAPDRPSEHPAASYVLHVNGADRPVTDAWIGESLLYVLRERLGLAGAKDGCSQGECGACNVQVDGRLVASCLVPAATTAGSEVRTVEGLAVDGEPSDVQRALARCGAVQCGFCIPGMAMTVHDLLEGNHAPSELETRQALCGNLCRCSGYRGVLDAVREVVAGREAAGTDDEEPRIPHQAAPGAGSVQPHAHEGDPR
ncbi:2Fe-2S iron-sulfur cluster-binding protein [Streptomyces sp. NPDC058637]|uniref:2Fe-2S iron-sulfur cluster-binding protein n=1 Tax=Streptomyces sp. NPDC058637 TaxID=3346569 RepID=UPI00365617D9